MSRTARLDAFQGMTWVRSWLGGVGAASLLALACSDTGASPSKPQGATAGTGGTIGTSSGGSSSQLTGGNDATPTAGVAGEVGGGETLSATLSVGRLRTEYRLDPIGIDATKPRLDWLLESEARAQRQSAYRVLVASTAELLAAGNGDLWDSGKVSSAESIQIAYGGAALAPRQRAWWKVRVWDGDDLPSKWSEPAFWERGLRTEDWTAAWLSAGDGEGSLSGAAGSGPPTATRAPARPRARATFAKRSRCRQASRSTAPAAQSRPTTRSSSSSTAIRSAHKRAGRT
jgi:hypothetical protein